MTDQHPITPPPELEMRWADESPAKYSETNYVYERHIATQATRWGWDQRNATVAAELQQARDEELEACCEWLKADGYPGTVIDLRAARRPKPPSLKEQALESLHHLEAGCEPNIPLLRRALEALDD